MPSVDVTTTPWLPTQTTMLPLVAKAFTEKDAPYLIVQSQPLDDVLIEAVVAPVPVIQRPRYGIYATAPMSRPKCAMGISPEAQVRPSADCREPPRLPPIT